uniref:NF-kappa-B inhibitor-interacting Ras-like protein 2 n=1 Tax=Cyprinus carpio TaxID=7962 RepID=A0A8C2K5T3_CYPCA
MGKSCKVVVCGQGSVGKTAVLEQLLYANHVAGSETMETLEDIYIGSVETDRGTREQVRFYDTRGLRDGHEFPRHYFTFADGFVLVYSIDSKESFKRVEALKKDIDRCRDKKEVCVFPMHRLHTTRRQLIGWRLTARWCLTAVRTYQQDTFSSFDRPVRAPRVTCITDVSNNSIWAQIQLTCK